MVHLEVLRGNRSRHRLRGFWRRPIGTALRRTCCLDVICAPDVHYDVPPQGSSYDQSCTADSDCVAVGFGDACLVCEIGCVANAAISKSAEAQYRSDVTETPANGADCGCPEGLPGGPCCIGGMCQFGSQCLATDAAADTRADACAPSGCATTCPAGTHDVSSIVNGCTVWQCCVSDNAGADAAADGGPADAGGE